MGCNCKTKKSSKNDDNVKVEGEKKFSWNGFVIATLMSIGVTIAFPFIWAVSIYNVYKNQVYGEAINISGFITKILDHSKKKESVSDEEIEINPDDYELVGVEKIK
jgi:hypothetical protein